MEIPTYDQLYNSFLSCLQDRNVHTRSELADYCAVVFSLSDDEKNACLSRGTNILKNRISWASTYLKKAGLVDTAGKGKYIITDEGIAALNSDCVIDNGYLMRYPSFSDFFRRKKKKSSDNTNDVPPKEEKSPLEQIQESVDELNMSLGDELMAEVMNLSCWQFEKFVIKLLVAMGYGSMLDNEDAVTKKVGDDGIDGILKADKFGFDSIYIQAKQWKKDSSVGSPEIRNFAGSMSIHGASKGLFITTAHFSQEAIRTASANPSCKIVLIDGDMLANLMIEYDIGVSTVETYKIKRVDSDFFSDID